MTTLWDTHIFLLNDRGLNSEGGMSLLRNTRRTNPSESAGLENRPASGAGHAAGHAPPSGGQRSGSGMKIALSSAPAKNFP